MAHLSAATDAATPQHGAPRSLAGQSVGRPQWTGAFYLNGVQAGALRQWPRLLDRAASLGLGTVVLSPPFVGASALLLDDPARLHPALAWGDDAAAGLRFLDAACRERDLAWMLDIRLDRVARDGAVARARPDLFGDSSAAVVDPRRGAPAGVARLPERQAALAEWWAQQIGGWLALGAAGMRLAELDRVPPALVQALGTALNDRAMLLGDLGAVPTPALGDWGASGLSAVGLGLEGWNFEADWFWTRHAALRRIAPVLIEIERPFGRRLAARHPAGQRAAALRRGLGLACGIGDGVLLSMGAEAGDTRPLNAHAGTALPEAPAPLVEAVPSPPPGGARVLPGGGVGTLAFLRGSGGQARLAVLNADLLTACTVELAALAHDLGVPECRSLTLPPGEMDSVALRPEPPILLPRGAPADTAKVAARSGRIAVEAVSPSIDGGQFPARRVVGDTVTVSCDVVVEGHDQISVLLQWRAGDAAAWTETRMLPLGNDRWTAGFVPHRLGRWEYRVVAWRDAYATFRDELTKKHAAGLDVRLEVLEGLAQVEEAAARVPALAPLVSRGRAAERVEQVALLLAGELALLMQQADPRPFAAETPVLPLDAERMAARFSAWYEIFPRSMSDDEARHGTFSDVVRQLPRIRDMGFDVLYFPPIHPIGRRNRKGRNNSLTPAPDDPGSPYAIGSEAGGHDAIHPELGTLDDFRALVSAAAEHGLELALDFAIQCSPDHPWLRQHKGWFDWRPDGSLRYAENPPKKYEDIVNVDFYAPDAVPGLWVALRDAVLFWVEQGVRIFRVDNPHTKPFPFWHWLIDDVRARYPDTMFLAEAFTRPKVMARLAKVGFGQSYTYFTWRNTRAEMETYLGELSAPPAAEFFRPNFFVNTPDINPVFLQTSGRPGFLIRAALAATLSGLWGVYCGFELCEAAALPGREEYLDSEKYQLRAWDWRRPGNIVPEITRLNHLRRHNAALQSHLGVTFLPSDNPMVMFFEKATADRGNVVLVAVSFDPFAAQSAAIELPLWRWTLPDQAALACEDLLHDTGFTLNGKHQRVTLTPDAPYVIWRAKPAS